MRVIRIPLNATDSTQLTRILHVKGLSDWSIERVAEQHLRKGHVVVLHLEELPESEEAQTSLFTLIDSLKGSLVSRYPEYESHIVTISTSNYPMLSSLSLPHFSVFHMLPPSPSQQTDLFRQLLEAMMKEKLSRERGRREGEGVVCARVCVEMSCVVCVSADMRWMNKMMAYVSYFSSRLLLRQLEKVREERGEREGGRECDDLVCVVEEVSGVRISLLFDEVFAESPIGKENGEREAEKRRRVDEQTYISTDGLFYLPARPEDRDVFQFAIPPPPLAELFTVCQMCWGGGLAPAVVVVAGERELCAERILVISDFLSKISSEQVVEIRVTIQDETDLPVVFGDPASPVLGGLPLFIEQITNPLMHNPRCGLVVADVSVYGQYALRELLESGQSETHKNQIRKEKILFILRVPHAAEITAQISSRAHWIWE